MHVCIDDHSRVAYVEELPDERKETCAEFLRRAVAWFQSRGVRVERVMTDIGSGYVSKHFASICAELGVRHLRTRPYRPQTNGKAERFIQTLMREWAYARAYPGDAARAATYEAWLHHYNHHRPHTGIGGAVPADRVHNLPRKYS